MSYRDILRAQLIVDEDLRQKPYLDTVGKLTVGVGRNLDDKGLSREECLYLLDNDIEDAEQDARTLFPSFERLSDARKAVVCNMAFNLGRDRLARFLRFREAVQGQDWERAAAEMLDSTWARQVGNRAVRLADQMRVG